VVWLAAAWLAVGLAAAFMGRLPGVAGAFGRVVAGRLLPRAALSLVAGTAGVGLLIAPVAAAAPAGGLGGASGGVNPDRPAPAWPVDSTSAPAWPTGTSTSPAAATPARGAGGGAPAGDINRADRPAGANSVTVRPGDCLWPTVHDHLGPAAGDGRIAREWPRWFAANRAVIGTDPGLLHPGQVLRAPAELRSTDPSRSSTPASEARP
jgi:nucleoid-associated protein YgaU